MKWLGQTCGYQRTMRAQYAKWGVPRNEKKSLSRVLNGKMLGSQLIEGKRVRVPSETIRKLVSLTVTTLCRPRVSKRWMQILGGRWVRVMQHEVATSACFGAFWEAMAHWPHSQAVPPAVAQELLLQHLLMPRFCGGSRLLVNSVIVVWCGLRTEFFVFIETTELRNQALHECI